jgi:murein L,D-transpeptidase YafK
LSVSGKLLYTMRKFIILFLFLLVLGAIAYDLYPEKSLPENSTIDSIVVIKSHRQLLAYSHGKLLKSYKVALGGNPIGDKQFEGDMKTPEGNYRIDSKNPTSGFHKNLGISYPDSLHSIQAARVGKSAGGDIKIHGLRNGLGLIGRFHKLTDWTNGCIALTNAQMDELYDHTNVGAPVFILP